jgi:hypothetical protein
MREKIQGPEVTGGRPGGFAHAGASPVMAPFCRAEGARGGGQRRPWRDKMIRSRILAEMTGRATIAPFLMLIQGGRRWGS